MKIIYFLFFILISINVFAGAPQVFNLDDLWFGKNNSNACKVLQFGSYNSNVGPIKYCPLEQKFYFSENNSNFYRFQSYLGYTPEFQLTFAGILNRNGNTINSSIQNSNINEWNIAYEDSHVHVNFGILENINYAFTTTLKTYYDAKAEVSYVDGLVSNTNQGIQLQILDILGLLSNTNSGVQDQIADLEGLINNTNSVIQGQFLYTIGLINNTNSVIQDQLDDKADITYVDGLVSNTNSEIQLQFLYTIGLINNTNSIIQDQLNDKAEITYVDGLVSNTNSGIQDQLSGKQDNLTFGSIFGTANQITLSGNNIDVLVNNNITLSLPQDINTAANVAFSSMNLNQEGTAAAVVPILKLYNRANAASMAGTGSSAVWYQTPFNNNAAVEMGEIQFSSVGNWTGTAGTQVTDFKIRRNGAGAMQDIMHADTSTVRFPNIYAFTFGGTDSSSFPYATIHMYSKSKSAAQTYANATPGGFLLNSYYATGDNYTRYADIISHAGTSTNENFAGSVMRFFIQPRITSSDAYNIMTFDYNKVATIYGSLNLNGTFILDNVTGLLKGTAGTVSAASAGIDYENPLTFNDPLSRSVNAVSCKVASATQSGCLDNDNFTVFNNKATTGYVDNAVSNANDNMRLYVDESISNTNSGIQLQILDILGLLSNTNSVIQDQLIGLEGLINNTNGVIQGQLNLKSDIAYVDGLVSNTNSGIQDQFLYTEGLINNTNGVIQEQLNNKAETAYVDGLVTNTNNAMKSYVDAGTFANVTLSNLSDTNINKSLVPNGNKTLDIGSEAKAWNNVFINNLNSTQIYSPTVISENSKNFFINGAMDFFQRSSSYTLTTSSAYNSADMWRIWYGGTVTGTPTVASSTTVPLNQYSKYSVQVGLRRNGTVGNINYEQRIEGAFARELLTSNNFSAGFMVYTPIANVTPTINVVIPSAEDNYATVATVYSNTNATAIPATTWTQIKWENISTNTNMMNGASIIFSLNIPTGTDGSAQNYLMTQAQLNKGAYLAPFSKNGKNIQNELAACERYGWAQKADGSAGADFDQCIASGNSAVACVGILPVTMRTKPTIDANFTSPANSWAVGHPSAGNVPCAGTLSLYAPGTTTSRADYSIGSCGTSLVVEHIYTLHSNSNTSAQIFFDASL